MIYLRKIALRKNIKSPNSFPFNLPLVKNFEELELTSPVTFFVGENGSGKSTILEAIAAGIGSIAVGGESIEQDSTLAHARNLGKALKFVWNRRTHRGFFLRAEDFFRFARRMHDLNREMADTAEEFEGKFSGYGLMLAKGAVLGQKAEIVSRYGENLDANSHGESFLQLFQARFVKNGLYLLDEPEAPLSPLRQLSFLSLLKKMVNEGNSQFIIATHSPILMAFPDGEIINFEESTLKKVDYEEIEHVTLTRDFLNNPKSFLRHL